jgi:hypothetical protein
MGFMTSGRHQRGENNRLPKTASVIKAKEGYLTYIGCEINDVRAPKTGNPNTDSLIESQSDLLDSTKDVVGCDADTPHEGKWPRPGARA